MVLNKFRNPQTTTGKLKQNMMILASLLTIVGILIEVAVSGLRTQEILLEVAEFLTIYPAVGGMGLATLLMLYLAARIDDYIQAR